MDKWRSIDYEKRLKRGLELLEKSSISESNKRLILKYKNFRLAKGLSLARVHREVQSLRLLCEYYGIDLKKLDSEALDELLANLELSGTKPSTINEYKKTLKYLLSFVGREGLASRIKRKEPTNNEITRDDFLSVDEI